VIHALLVSLFFLVSSATVSHSQEQRCFMTKPFLIQLKERGYEVIAEYFMESGDSIVVLLGSQLGNWVIFKSTVVGGTMCYLTEGPALNRLPMKPST
jgi:hypothetical protein